MVTKQDLRNRLLVLPKDWCGDKGEEESSTLLLMCSFGRSNPRFIKTILKLSRDVFPDSMSPGDITLQVWGYLLLGIPIGKVLNRKPRVDVLRFQETSTFYQ